MGYVIDVYYEIGEPEKNILKLALFGYYFPTMISGPIIRYRDMKEQLYTGHPLVYKNVTYGIQRMVWGFFKKLVISERMGLIVDTVFNNYADHSGFTIIIAGICFTFQLYTDFSGCMDIVLGASETFGIILPENFETPFFSRNIAEYWRRWHITLGTWLKEYLFYPLLRTKFFSSLPKQLKEKYGKKTAKKITTYLAMLILWFTIGFWHGGVWKYIIGSGLLHWFYIVSGEVLEPVWKKLKSWFHVKDDSKGFIFFQRARTFVLVTIGLIFFRADNAVVACKMLASIFRSWNPEIFWNGYLFELGLDWIEFTIAIVSLVMLLIVSILQQTESIRDRIARQRIVLPMGDLAVRKASMAVKESVEVDIDSRSIMGVVVPVIESTSTKTRTMANRGYGFMDTSVKLDEAAKKFEESIKLIIELGEIEKTIILLAEEIESTKRRVNALEHIIIPRVENTVKYIEMRLEEMERESFVRLKMIKKTMEME